MNAIICSTIDSKINNDISRTSFNHIRRFRFIEILLWERPRSSEITNNEWNIDYSLKKLMYTNSEKLQTVLLYARCSKKIRGIINFSENK